MLVVIMWMPISHTSLHFFVLSLVLACVCAYVACEDQVYKSGLPDCIFVMIFFSLLAKP